MSWLHRYTRLVSVASLTLIVAGGLVTSTDSGLAVPDWPTSYGYFMFSFPLSKMVGGILYEHGHRLIASVVGILTVVLAGWIYCVDPRRWVKRLGILSLVAVCIQGLLGGLTVLYFLPTPISVSHAGLAQIFFGLIVSLTLFTSPSWLEDHRDLGLTKSNNPLSVASDSMLQRITIVTTVIIYTQILIGAVLRHTGAGLAIPDFPLMFGQLIPSEWNQGVFLHFTHRIGALITLLAILATGGHVWFHHREKKEILRPALLLMVLVTLQIILGGWTVLSAKAVSINTAHVATGALLFATAIVLALRTNRNHFSEYTPQTKLTDLPPSTFSVNPATKGHA